MISSMNVEERQTAAAMAEEQSYRLLPEAWYEKRFRLPLLQIALIIFLYWLAYPHYLLEAPTWLSFMGVSAYFFGWLADMISTWRLFRLRPAFERNHLPFPLAERSPFVRESTSLLGVLASPGTLMMMFLLVAIWFFPAVGLAIAPVQLAAATNNRRKRKRVILHLRLFDEMMQGETGKGAPEKKNRPETHSNVMKWPVVNPI